MGKRVILYPLTLSGIKTSGHIQVSGLFTFSPKKIKVTDTSACTLTYRAEVTTLA